MNETSSHGKRLDWLDALRGFALLTVVVAHADEIPGDIRTLIYSFHMPLFFMISGFTFRYEKYDSLKACVRDQAKRLLVPYVALYLVSLPCWYVNRVIFGHSKHTLLEEALGIFAANFSISPMPNGALWFLPALFLTTVVIWLLCDLAHRGKLRLGGSIVACFALGVCLSTFGDDPWPWHLNCIPITVCFYYLGHLFRKAVNSYTESKRNISEDAWSLVGCTALALGVWAAFTNGEISVHANEYGIMALALLSSVGISLGLAILFMYLPTIRALAFAGRHSLTIFGLHIPLLRFFENFPLTESFSAAHPLWVTFATFVLLLPIAFIVDRYLPFLAGRWPSKGSLGARNVREK